MKTRTAMARVVAALGCAVPVAVSAGTVACVGTVDQLAFHSPGRLMLRLSSMNTPVFICSVDALWAPAGAGYTTTPAACKTLYATFLTAKLTREVLNYVHFDGDEVPASCNAWATWANANVRYFGY
jgi:hypothetical protein